MARNRKSALKIEVVTSRGAPRSFASVEKAKAHADRAAAGGKPLTIKIGN